METARRLKPHEHLTRALARKQKRNEGYSQRSLARDLGVSPVFVTKLLSGKKSIPAPRVKRLCKLLDMDVNAETELMQSMVLEQLPSADLKKVVLDRAAFQSHMPRYESASPKRFGVLRDWYTIAILNLVTCEIDATPENMARRLGLTREQVARSLEGLRESDLVRELADGAWERTSDDTFFPTTKSQGEVRDFHRQMIRKAYEELAKTEQRDFDQRLITGFTIACDPSKMDVAKKRIFDFLSELSQEMSEGECREVYQCNVQMFPLTKGGRK